MRVLELPLPEDGGVVGAGGVTGSCSPVGTGTEFGSLPPAGPAPLPDDPRMRLVKSLAREYRPKPRAVIVITPIMAS